LHPDPDRFPHGQALVQDAFERRGSTPPLTTDATKYLLLLSIQWGENWCYWYWHAQDLPDLIDTLVIAWHRPSWVRVSGRVAHLLQKHPWQEVEAAIARELGDRLPPELESWVEAVRERRVFEFVEEVQRHSRKVDEWSLLLTELREVDC
jgi:hypothetical protein